MEPRPNPNLRDSSGNVPSRGLVGNPRLSHALLSGKAASAASPGGVEGCRAPDGPPCSFPGTWASTLSPPTHPGPQGPLAPSGSPRPASRTWLPRRAGAPCSSWVPWLLPPSPPSLLHCLLQSAPPPPAASSWVGVTSAAHLPTWPALVSDLAASPMRADCCPRVARLAQGPACSGRQARAG